MWVWIRQQSLWKGMHDSFFLYFFAISLPLFRAAQISEASWGLVVCNEEGAWPPTGRDLSGCTAYSEEWRLAHVSVRGPMQTHCLPSWNPEPCGWAMSKTFSMITGKYQGVSLMPGYQPQPENHMDSLWGPSCYTKWSSNLNPAQSCGGTPASRACYWVAVPVGTLNTGSLCIYAHSHSPDDPGLKVGSAHTSLAGPHVSHL